MKTPTLENLQLTAACDPPLFEHQMRSIGLLVIGKKNNDPLELDVQSEAIASLASTITEDVDDNIQLDDYHRKAKLIAEKHGYLVKVQ